MYRNILHLYVIYRNKYIYLPYVFGLCVYPLKVFFPTKKQHHDK